MRVVMWIPALAMIFGAPFTLADDTDTDLAQLQGTWSIVRMEDGTRKASDVELVAMSIQFKKSACFIRDGGGEELETAVNIDATKDPKWIGTRDKEFGDVMEGIYKFDGDTLTMCFGRSGKRPSKFIISNREEKLMVLKRKK